MAKAPYYEGDTVRIEFAVEERGEPVNPVSVDVVVVDDVDNLIYEGMAKLQDNQVLFAIPPEGTNKAGKYVAIFTVKLPGNVIRTNRKAYRILPKGPVVSEAFDKTGMPIDGNSSYGQINLAVGEATRALRRLGKSSKEAAEAVSALVEKRTGRRLSI